MFYFQNMPQEQEAYPCFFPFYAALLDKQKTVKHFKIQLTLTPIHVSTHAPHCTEILRVLLSYIQHFTPIKSLFTLIITQ